MSTPMTGLLANDSPTVLETPTTKNVRTQRCCTLGQAIRSSVGRMAPCSPASSTSMTIRCRRVPILKAIAARRRQR